VWLTQLSVVSAYASRRFCSSSPVPPGFLNSSTSWRVRSYWSLETIGWIHSRYFFRVSANSGIGSFGNSFCAPTCRYWYILAFRHYVTFGYCRRKSVCRLSVCNVGDIYSEGWTIPHYFAPYCSLAIWLGCKENSENIRNRF